MKPAGRLFVFVGLVLTLSLAGYVFVSRKTTSPKTDNDDGKLVVAATIFPLYDLVRQVAGDSAHVILVLPPGASPHTFEPSPTIARSLAEADILFKVGYGLDDWATGLVGNDTDIITIGPDKYDGLLCEDSVCDPHFWMSPRIAMGMADGIRASLMNADQAHIGRYDERGRALVQNLESLNEEARAILSNASNRHLLTFHDAFEYFANDYNLDIVGTFEPSPGREPTAKDLRELNRLVREFNIKTVYTEPQSSTSEIQAFTQDLRLNIKVLDDLGGVEGRETYQDLIRYNANIIASANP